MEGSLLLLTERERDLRKVRKKLRQIEHLEHLQRHLNQEELAKVAHKAQLRRLLDEMKRKSNDKGDQGEAGADGKRKCAAAAGDAPVLGDVGSESSVDQSHHHPTSSLNQEEQLEISVPASRTPTRDLAAEPVSTHDSEEDASEYVRVEVSTPAKKGGKKKFNKSTWRGKSLIVHELVGHEDFALASALNVDGDVAMTSSRDTRVLVWKLSSREQTFSLRGHTGMVGAVAILPATAAGQEDMKLPAGSTIGLSGSLDCSLKVWNLNAGEMIKSIYTYNGIKSLAYCSVLKCAVTGTDGGKLEFWRLSDGKNLHSVSAHDDAITALDVSGSLVATGCRDGMIKVWEVDTAKGIKCLYVSEDVRPAEDEQCAHLRCVLSLKLLPPMGGRVAYGDSGCNVKILDWRDGGGLLHKLPNHTGDMGFTDCLAVCGNLLLASSYDLDGGLGHVNAFHLRQDGGLPAYVCSFADEETGRVFSLSGALTGEAEVALLTAGKEVKLWRTVAGTGLPQEDAMVVRPTVLPLYAREALDSGSSSSEDDGSGDDVAGRRSAASSAAAARKGWSCSVL